MLIPCTPWASIQNLNQTPRHVAMAADDTIKAGFFMNGIDFNNVSFCVFKPDKSETFFKPDKSETF